MRDEGEPVIPRSTSLAACRLRHFLSPLSNHQTEADMKENENTFKTLLHLIFKKKGGSFFLAPRFTFFHMSQGICFVQIEKKKNILCRFSFVLMEN